MTRFVVLGAGAIGCWAAGVLALAGERPLLVGRARVVEALLTHGLRVSDLDGLSEAIPPDRFDAACSLSEAVERMGPAALAGAVVLLCVKGGDTRDAAREAAQALPAGTPVVSLQNGVDNPARVREAAPALDPVAGMVPFNVVMPQPGAPHRATGGAVRLQDAPAARRLAEALRAAGQAVELHADLLPVQWGKLLLNLNNPVNALSGLPLREQLLRRDYRRALALLQDEALAALAAAGIEPARLAAVAPRLLPKLLRLPDWLFALAARRMLRIDPRARSSMWDDVQAGRVTEIDDFCGAVVRLAEAHGAAAPANRRMVELVGRHAAGQDWSGQRLLAALSDGRDR